MSEGPDAGPGALPAGPDRGPTLPPEAVPPAGSRRPDGVLPRPTPQPPPRAVPTPQARVDQSPTREAQAQPRGDQSAARDETAVLTPRPDGVPRPASASRPGAPDVRSGPARPRPTTTSAARPVQRSRRARLALRRIDPWSTFVLSLLISLFLGVVTIVAGVVLYAVLDRLGVPASVNTAVTEVKGGSPPLTSSRFVGVAALLAAVNVVLLTALATLGALLYNLCASFTGGVEVTLAEGD